MAVPKKRKGHSAQGHKRAQWKASVPTLATCRNCNEKKLPHTVCSYCGHYDVDKPAYKELQAV